MQSRNKVMDTRNNVQVKKCTKSLNYGLLAGTILLGLSLGLVPAKASTTDDAAVNATTPKVDDTQTVSETPTTQPATVSLGKSNVSTPTVPKAPAKPEKPVTAVQPQEPVTVDSKANAED